MSERITVEPFPYSALLDQEGPIPLADLKRLPIDPDTLPLILHPKAIESGGFLGVAEYPCVPTDPSRLERAASQQLGASSWEGLRLTLDDNKWQQKLDAVEEHLVMSRAMDTTNWRHVVWRWTTQNNMSFIKRAEISQENSKGTKLERTVIWQPNFVYVFQSFFWN